MKTFDDDYPLAALRAALSHTVVACGAILLVSAAAAALIQIVALWEWPLDSEELWVGLYLWAGHWVLAGVMIWGVGFMPLHFWGLYKLLMTDTDPIAPLLIVFINQTAVSTIITCIAYDSWEGRSIRATAMGILLVLLAIFALWVDHKRRKTTVLGE